MANSNLRSLLELPVDVVSAPTNNGQTDSETSSASSSSSSSMPAVIPENIVSCVIPRFILDLWGNEIQTILSGVQALTALTVTSNINISAVNSELQELSTKLVSLQETIICYGLYEDLPSAQE